MIGTRKVGAIEVIEVGGPLNASSVSELTNSFDECARRGTLNVVIDLDRTPLIDSQGLEALLEIQQVCLRRGGALKLVAATKNCQDILRITEVEKSIEVFDSVNLATGSFVI